MYSNLEDMLVKVVKKENYDEELKCVVAFYKDDFNQAQLSMQFKLLSSNISSDSPQD